MNQTLSQSLLRVFFAIPFALFGVMYLIFADNMQGMVPSYVPGGVIWVYTTGVLLILGAASFIIKKSVQLDAYLLGGLKLMFINYKSASGNWRRSELDFLTYKKGVIHFSKKAGKPKNQK